MNTPEKLAALYLRLNGFFLLPRFTVFAGGQHTDIDILGLRSVGACEQVESYRFPQDASLIDPIRELPLVMAIGQVKGGVSSAIYTASSHIQYAHRLAPTASPVSFAFHEGPSSLAWDSSQPIRTVSISLLYVNSWIRQRVIDTNRDLPRFLKDGSWSWSEPFLSDYLYLTRIAAG
jgi:hypothetical protein